MAQSKQLTCRDAIKDALCLTQSGRSDLLRALLFKIQQPQHDDQYPDASIEALLTRDVATMALPALDMAGLVF